MGSARPERLDMHNWHYRSIQVGGLGRDGLVAERHLCVVEIDRVTAREHPTKRAQDRTLAPTVSPATTPHGANALDKPPDRSEQQVQGQQAGREPLGISHCSTSTS